MSVDAAAASSQVVPTILLAQDQGEMLQTAKPSALVRCGKCVTSKPLSCIYTITPLALFALGFATYRSDGSSDTKTVAAFGLCALTFIQCGLTRGLQKIASLQKVVTIQQQVVNKQEQVLDKGIQFKSDLQLIRQSISESNSQAQSISEGVIKQQQEKLVAQARHIQELKAEVGRLHAITAKWAGIASTFESYKTNESELAKLLSHNKVLSPSAFQHRIVEPIENSNHETSINIELLQQTLSRMESTRDKLSELSQEIHGALQQLEQVAQNIIRERAEIEEIRNQDDALLLKCATEKQAIAAMWRQIDANCEIIDAEWAKLDIKKSEMARSLVSTPPSDETKATVVIHSHSPPSDTTELTQEV